MRHDYFGPSVADRYDEDDAGMFAPEVLGPAVDFLAALASEDQAAEPSAFELGIGTGRIALPLSQRGVLVHGVDLSEAMVARLRAKPGRRPRRRHDRRLRHRPGRTDVPARVPRLQHDRKRDLAG